MDPILRVWFAYDCAPHEVEHHAENAAVDLSWALQDAGLLASPATSDVIAELCANVDRLRAERDAALPDRDTLEAYIVTALLTDQGEKNLVEHLADSLLAHLVPYRPGDTP